MAHYPLLFGFHQVVLCRGFLAGVSLSDARALVEQEDDGWWVYGVNPGPIAESGALFSEAVQNFLARFRSVLADFASEAKNFEDFQRAVVEFVQASDQQTVTEWEQARAEVRSGKATLEGLPKETANRLPRVVVSLVNMQPSENPTQPVRRALAA